MRQPHALAFAREFHVYPHRRPRGHRPTFHLSMGTDDENVQEPSTHRFASVPSVVSFSLAANQKPRLRQTAGNRRRAFVTLGTPTLGMLGPRSRPGCPRGAGLPRVARLRPLPKGTLM